MIHAFWSQDQNLSLLCFSESIKRTDTRNSPRHPRVVILGRLARGHSAVLTGQGGELHYAEGVEQSQGWVKRIFCPAFPHTEKFPTAQFPHAFIAVLHCLGAFTFCIFPFSLSKKKSAHSGFSKRSLESPTCLQLAFHKGPQDLTCRSLLFVNHHEVINQRRTGSISFHSIPSWQQL